MSPVGWTQVRSMEVAIGEAVRPVGEGGGATRIFNCYSNRIILNNSLIQLTPSPLYPWLQVQVKLPGVLLHSALGSQLSVLVLHSLSSIIIDKILDTYT